MGEVVDLHGRSSPLEDDELIENLARFADNTLSESAVKARHHLSNEDWAALGENDKLVEIVEARKLQRIRGGQTKRERAQLEIIDGPPILGKIMRDPGSNARHVVDAVKTLDALATGGSSEAAAATDRFQITINLSGDGVEHTLHFDKSISINPADRDPFNDDDTNVATPWGLFLKKDGGDNGGHL